MILLLACTSDRLKCDEKDYGLPLFKFRNTYKMSGYNEFKTGTVLLKVIQCNENYLMHFSGNIIWSDSQFYLIYPNECYAKTEWRIMPFFIPGITLGDSIVVNNALLLAPNDTNSQVKFSITLSGIECSENDTIYTFQQIFYNEIPPPCYPNVDYYFPLGSNTPTKDSISLQFTYSIKIGFHFQCITASKQNHNDYIVPYFTSNIAAQYNEL